MTAQIVFLLVGAYVLGSIPFGLLVARAFAGVDIRHSGSGNIGATNVQRVLGWKAALPVLLFDVGKGLIPALVARYLQLSAPPTFSVVGISLLAGFAAVLGHCASPFLKFKGGKGVATICGAAIGGTPDVALIGISAFLLATIVTRYISVASIVAVLAAALAAYLLPYDGLVMGAYLAICLFIMYKHRSNVRRLMKGEEPKFNFRGKGQMQSEAPDDAPSEQSKELGDEQQNEQERIG